MVLFDKESDLTDPLINYGTDKHTKLLKVVGYIFCDLLNFYVSDENKNFLVFSANGKKNNPKDLKLNI